jgi:pimeloyl-ACP methyl ester carboxylesterase
MGCIREEKDGFFRMADAAFLPGISSEIVQTPRLATHLLTSGPQQGESVVFVHGNVSSAVFWEETMLALPTRYRAIAVDLRGFGDSETAPVDATRGVRDFADDLHALAEALKLGRFHLVEFPETGHSPHIERPAEFRREFFGFLAGQG